MPIKAAKSRRRPGILFRLISRVPSEAPKWLHDYTRELDHLLQKIWFALDNSLPGKHRLTHMGGNDSVAGSGTPVPVVAGVEGSRGEPRQGYAPFNHAHALDLGPIIPDLLDLIPGSPNPPFHNLRDQLNWYTTQANLAHALRPLTICRWR
ncbi:MAG: hypothetical protein ACREIQ_13040 [Nitrospiria bacterium]